MEKIKLYSNVREEQGVVMAFTKIHEFLGFPKLVMASARGLDINDIEYEKNGIKERVAVEFEYVSSNFVAHGHVNQLDINKKCIVVCWKNDVNLVSVYPKYKIEVIELEKYFDVVPDEKIISNNEVKYHLIMFVRDEAANYSFNDFAKVNLFRLPKRNIAKGDRVLIREADHIVGGFDVVNYFNIEMPQTDKEWELYQNLTSYPVSLYFDSVEDLKPMFNKGTWGHIFYDNYFAFDNFSTRKKVGELVERLENPNRKQAYQEITETEYNQLIGNK